MLGDLILAEPSSYWIRRQRKEVIEQTLREKLPENFQTAEYLLEHGFVDVIVKRKDLKTTLTKILKIHGVKNF